MHTDLMVDIETLGTGPNAPILSIGAIVFTRETGVKHEKFHVRCKPDLANYDVDMDTLYFWLQQDDDARHSLLKNPVALPNALHQFAGFFNMKMEPKATVWALPPSFDVNLLENAFRKENVTIPWHYSAPRCLRTVFDLAGIEKKDRVTPEVAHDALSDCQAQIATLAKALNRIKVLRPIPPKDTNDNAG